MKLVRATAAALALAGIAACQERPAVEPPRLQAGSPFEDLATMPGPALPYYVTAEDAELERRVQRTLAAAQDLDAREVYVTAAEGVVIFAARTGSAESAERIVQAVSALDGVVEVVSRLTVESRS